MPRQLYQLGVLLSDMTGSAEEMGATTPVVEELSRRYERKGIRLKLLGWSDVIPPGLHSDPDSVIRQKLASEVDIYVAILGVGPGYAVGPFAISPKEEY